MTTRMATRKAKSLIAGAAGVALLLAGGTWALWSDTASLEGADTVSGNLDLAPAGPVTAWDISDIRGLDDASGAFVPSTPGPRDDQTTRLYDEYPSCLGYDVSSGMDYYDVFGHEAKLIADDPADKTWKTVPGDTFAVVFPYVVALEGDNLVAELAVDVDTTSAVFSDSLIDVALEAWVEDDQTAAGGFNDPRLWFALDDTETRDLFLNGVAPDRGFYMQAQGEPMGLDDPDDAGGLLPMIGRTEIATGDDIRTNANVCLVMKATFDPETHERNEVRQTLIGVTKAQVRLQQVRELPTGLGYFG